MPRAVSSPPLARQKVTGIRDIVLKSLIVGRQSESQYPNATVATTTSYEVGITTTNVTTTTMEDTPSITAEVEVHTENTIPPHERGDTLTSPGHSKYS